MKRQMSRTFIAYICLFGLIISSSSSEAQEQVLHLATIEDFRPFVWSEDGRAAGIDSEIVSEAARRAGIKIRVSFMPWKRVMYMTRKGTVDGAFTSFRTPEREVFADFLSYPLHLSRYNLFVVKGSEFPFRSVRDLYGKSVGIIRGFSLGSEFDEAKKSGNIPVQEVATIGQNIQMLLMGRIGAYLGNFHSTLYYIKTAGVSDRIAYLPEPVQKPREAYLVISKKAEIKDREQVIRRLNKALKSMQEDGSIEIIHSKYLN